MLMRVIAKKHKIIDRFKNESYNENLRQLLWMKNWKKELENTLFFIVLTHLNFFILIIFNPNPQCRMCCMQNCNNQPL